ncbi:hypothetical protein H072_10982 [Dactylellina haptotyla CBS 200.50]|uniref:F5/8 type C domain-containing protein n=1 Tax=Dactylellina haptotyla (strain CBS 200.50) TaxID=1284197 RepID=S7ZXW9_DACHA|nr:hypothetical protein H072_10982 [Dactylellina haptotyla CBS 200.50]
MGLNGKSAPAITRPIAKSIQLQADTPYPKVLVSVGGADVNRVHDVIDGRIWFFPETEGTNGWDSPTGGSEVWYQIDFGSSTATRTGVEKDVSSPVYTSAVANGITRASWTSVSVNQIRIAFTPKSGMKVRLVEFKFFSDLVRDPVTTTTTSITTTTTTTARTTTATTLSTTASRTTIYSIYDSMWVPASMHRCASQYCTSKVDTGFGLRLP